MLTKTLSEAKKKQRASLIKAMNNDIGSIDFAKDSWNPAQISERAKDISYIRSLVDSWNPAQLNEALKMLDLPVIDTWNPAQIEEQRRNLVFYLAERTLTGNPITLKILGNLTPEVTNLKVTMNPIQDLSHGEPSPTNICPISGRTEVSVKRTGKNLANPAVMNIFNRNRYFCTTDYTVRPSIQVAPNTQYILSCRKGVPGSSQDFQIRYWNREGEFISGEKASPFTTPSNCFAISFYCGYGDGDFTDVDNAKVQVELGSTATAYEPYTAETHTRQYSETIYGGVDDFVNGGLSVEWGYIASYDGETLPGEWLSDRDVYAPDTTPTTGAEVAYKLATPTTISTTAEEITLLKGTNVLSTDGDSIELKYKQNF